MEDTSTILTDMVHRRDQELHETIDNERDQPILEKDGKMFTWNNSATFTQEEDAAVQYRPRHLYIISRPKVIQYAYKGQIVQSEGISHSNDGDGSIQGIDEATARSRERLDLFIDLIWVGIIGNISEAFSTKAFASEDRSAADAFVLILLVFLPAWRIWNGVREILNNYYSDDLFQRLYIFLLLVLSVFFGNNLAYTAEKPESAKATSISLYLFIRASLILLEVAYCIFIPWLRRIVLLTVLLYLPSIGLWTAGLYLDGAKAYGAIAAAIFMDYTIPTILDLSATRDKFLGGYGKALDPGHFTSRMASFFIITIGEGVLQLVRDGPLGIGVTQAAGYSVCCLLIYFLLTLLYFNRDMSQRFVPAVVRKGGRTWMWITMHIPIFLSVLALSAGIMYTVRETAAHLDIETASPSQAPPSPEAAARLESIAVWTIAISLATTILSMAGMALLDQPRDSEGRMRINNRYIRLAGRPIYAAIVLCIPIAEAARPETFLEISALLLALLAVWEYVASTERGNRLVEPGKKSATENRNT